MADIDDEARRNLAAAVIQKHWGDFRRQQELAKADEAAQFNDGDDDDDLLDGGALGEKELTEEEERAQLLARAEQLYEERRESLARNAEQQRTLAKIFAERRAQQVAEGLAPKDGGQQPFTADGEAKYWELVGKLRGDQQALEARTMEGNMSFRAFRQKNEAVIEEALQCETGFRDEVMGTAKAAVFPRNNKGIPVRRLEEYRLEEARLSEEVQRVRVQYIRLRNKSERLARQLKRNDNQHDGMHLIDFEQLKIENTNLNEKIEERNEDLLKLRKKATTTIHILTHVKEKLEFVKAENLALQKSVHDLEDTLASLRDQLAQTKRNRDVFVNENQRMREKTPMIGSEDLLLDYELRKKEIETLRVEVVNLTNQHHELLQWIASHQPAPAPAATV